jgi:serine/threonine protein kinase
MRLLLGVAEGMRHLHDEGLVHGCREWSCILGHLAKRLIGGPSVQAKRIRVDQYVSARCPLSVHCLMLFHQNVPKLVDFGISAIVQDCIVGELDTTYFLYKRIRERWAAPEQLVSSFLAVHQAWLTRSLDQICPRDSDRKARPSAETDTFVFGLVVMEVLTNYVPYVRSCLYVVFR